MYTILTMGSKQFLIILKILPIGSSEIKYTFLVELHVLFRLCTSEYLSWANEISITADVHDMQDEDEKLF